MGPLASSNFVCQHVKYCYFQMKISVKSRKSILSVRSKHKLLDYFNPNLKYLLTNFSPINALAECVHHSHMLTGEIPVHFLCAVHRYRCVWHSQVTPQWWTIICWEGGGGGGGFCNINTSLTFIFSKKIHHSLSSFQKKKIMY